MRHTQRTFELERQKKEGKGNDGVGRVESHSCEQFKRGANELDDATEKNNERITGWMDGIQDMEFAGRH